jgi:RNA polymerase sigma-70 factor (ECF subfamily)
MFAELDPRRLDVVVAREPEDDTWAELEQVLDRLPTEQREAIVLKYADDLTYEEMSRITGAGESALKMRVQRAFARLRAMLQEVPSV